MCVCVRAYESAHCVFYRVYVRNVRFTTERERGGGRERREKREGEREKL